MIIELFYSTTYFFSKDACSNTDLNGFPQSAARAYTCFWCDINAALPPPHYWCTACVWSSVCQFSTSGNVEHPVPSPSPLNTPLPALLHSRTLTPTHITVLMFSSVLWLPLVWSGRLLFLPVSMPPQCDWGVKVSLSGHKLMLHGQTPKLQLMECNTLIYTS